MSKQASKTPSKAVVIRTLPQRVNACVACFADLRQADADIVNAYEARKAVRKSIRWELSDAKAQWPAGKLWKAFLKALRLALVKAGVCPDTRSAGRLVDNELMAAKLTGNSGYAPGGRRKGAGRKETTTTGEEHNVTAEAALWNKNALDQVAAESMLFLGEADVLEAFSRITLRLQGK